jgi:deoxyribose-phosphate aldolase
MAPKIPPSAELEALLKKPEGTSLSWLAPLIDHTLLKPDATEPQILKLCEEARIHGFGAVCVNPAYVKLCASSLRGSAVKTAAVVGFPLGAQSTRTKVFETKEAIHHGATEIDMVMQVGLLKNRSLRAVFLDIRKVVLACGDIPLKVILETSLLDQEEKVMAATIAKAAGAAFLKTSTGFSQGGATIEDVKLLRRIAVGDMGVKASGGVRSLQDALQMVLAGADRIGTSSGIVILGKTPQDGQSGVY